MHLVMALLDRISTTSGHPAQPGTASNRSDIFKLEFSEIESKKMHSPYKLLKKKSKKIFAWVSCSHVSGACLLRYNSAMRPKYPCRVQAVYFKCERCCQGIQMEGIDWHMTLLQCNLSNFKQAYKQLVIHITLDKRSQQQKATTICANINRLQQVSHSQGLWSLVSVLLKRLHGHAFLTSVRVLRHLWRSNKLWLHVNASHAILSQPTVSIPGFVTTTLLRPKVPRQWNNSDKSHSA